MKMLGACKRDSTAQTLLLVLGRGLDDNLRFTSPCLDLSRPHRFHRAIGDDFLIQHPSSGISSDSLALRCALDHLPWVILVCSSGPSLASGRVVVLIRDDLSVGRAGQTLQIDAMHLPGLSTPRRSVNISRVDTHKLVGNECRCQNAPSCGTSHETDACNSDEVLYFVRAHAPSGR
ncbi:hypothetical protein HDV57DRAFT_119291 [Trichoderma longibrachiatum]|uniref:Uncharacterized protein n=1 Tax=Trichoderma longibrachiatum ATCC 18648 TaxID=983965 RepID=A0A2T4BUA6_TRILO|nr:hypothetical protein M440DRAFT_1086307 [Trichoderma longibrachiatum ATCC 18648]